MAVAFQQRFSMSNCDGFMVSLWLCPLPPRIQSSPLCLPKFYPINRPRKFHYSLLVIIAHKGNSHILTFIQHYQVIIHRNLYWNLTHLSFTILLSRLRKIELHYWLSLRRGTRKKERGKIVGRIYCMREEFIFKSVSSEYKLKHTCFVKIKIPSIILPHLKFSLLFCC